MLSGVSQGSMRVCVSPQFLLSELCSGQGGYDGGTSSGRKAFPQSIEQLAVSLSFQLLCNSGVAFDLVVGFKASKIVTRIEWPVTLHLVSFSTH